MRVLFLPGLSVFLFAATLLGQDETITLPKGYFFPPPKSLYYFRPDLYVYQVARPSYYPARFSPVDLTMLRTSPMRPHVPATYFPGYSRGPLYNREIYRLILSSPPTGDVVRVNTSDIVFRVTPPKALIYVDERLIGSAGDFSNDKEKYTLVDGEHSLKIEFPGFQTYSTKMQIVPNKTLHFEYELQKTP